MIKAVIFDMDGVLVNSEPYHFEVEKQLLRELGISITDEELESFVGLALDKMWGRLKKSHGLKDSIDSLAEKDTESRVSYFASLEKLEPIEGVRELIRNVRDGGLKTAVASSSHSRLISTVLEKTGLSEYFPVIVSGVDMEHGKPSPDIFIKTAEILGTGTEECLVIEDSLNGVTAAKAAGMKCIGFRNPASGSQDLSAADIIIDSFDSIGIDNLKTI